MKSLKIILPVIMFSFFILFSCNNDADVKQNPAEKDVLAFEAEFIKSLNYEENDNVKLIGFKKIELPKEEVAEFNALYENKEEWNKLKNYYYDKEKALIRVYFPVEGALVEHHSTFEEANASGELDMTISHVKNNEVTVIGRKQTDEVTGVEGNVIKDGIIYLAEKNKSIHNIGNVYVFDFGTKMIMDHDSHSEAGERVLKASCMSNHGGPNCSNKYGIHKGRCTFNSRVCMDYNGWFTNCKNGKYSNFPGSDCDYALGRGHCWSEVM